MTESTPAWHIFAALQSEADPQSIDRSLARDEALDSILGDLVTDPAPSEELVLKHFHSLCRNRLSKQKNRRAIDRRRFRSTHRRCGSAFGDVVLMPPASAAFDAVSYSELANLIRTVVAEDELMLLADIATGANYAEIASTLGTSIAGVKSKVFRAREKIRRSPVAGTLHHQYRHG